MNLDLVVVENKRRSLGMSCGEKGRLGLLQYKIELQFMLKYVDVYGAVGDLRMSSHAPCQ
jgi:hypothetical protein